MNWPVLSVTTFLPLLGVVAILLAKGEDEAANKYARFAALWTTVVTFLVSLLIAFNFNLSKTILGWAAMPITAWALTAFQCRLLCSPLS